MIHTDTFTENLPLLSEKAPDVAWKLAEVGRPLSPWKPFEVTGEVVFAIGIAEGLKPPAEGDRHLVLLDFDTAPLRAFLESVEARDLLSHPNVHLSLLDTDADYQYLQGFFSGLTAQVEIHPAYEGEERAKAAAERLLSDNHAAYCTVDELTRYPHLAVSHILDNLEALPQSIDAASLFGQFSKVPAIICGAGPSLNRHLPKLAELKDRALLFAPGSAIRVVDPHFGAFLDPYPAQSERMVGGCKVPCFYTGRWLPDARRKAEGPLLYVSGTEHPLSRWIDGELGIGRQPVFEGTCAVHLATELARLMGCDPIVFVGMDLAYTDGELYAEGVGDRRTLETRQEGSHYLDRLVEQLDVHGNPVWTQWKWLDEAKVLSDYAAQHPNTRFLNATGGGLGLDGIPNVMLDEIRGERLYLPPLSGTKVGSGEALKRQFLESLARCRELLIELLDMPKGGRRALCEVELEEEVAYQTYLARSRQAMKSKALRGALFEGDLMERLLYLIELLH